MPSPPPLSLVAKALLSAGGAAMPAAAAAMALSQSIAAEGAWGWKSNGEDVWPFQGTNNFGAIHATRSFAERYAQGGDVLVATSSGTSAVSYSSGWGMVAFLDHAPGAYVARMAVYPSLVAGAAAFLGLLSAFVDLANTTKPEDFAAQLYVHNYFVGFHPNRTTVDKRAAAYQSNAWSDDDVANIADYAAAIQSRLAVASAAIAAAASETGDPTDATHGPPFADLGLRLTPADKWAPHTIEHARQILGDAGVSPPAGGISLADALASPRGDGVWMFPEGVEVSSVPSPAPPAPVSRVVAEEFAAGAAVLGALAGAALLAAGLKWRPEWFTFGARAT
jgi:hypothetical protein